MTLVQILVRLTERLDALQAQLEGTAGMTPEQQASLVQALVDITALKAAVEALQASVNTEVTGLRADVTALQTEVATLKAGIGDLSGLPPI